MPSLGQLLSQLHAYVWGVGQQSGSKRWATAVAIVMGIVWLYKRVEHARAQERRVQRLRDARGNPMAANVALGQHLPSPLPPSYSSAAAAAAADVANDVRNLSPAERYLSERGSRVRRQAVCLTLAPDSHLVFESRSSADAPLRVQESAVPLLLSLAQCTTLHCIVVESNKDKQDAIIGALRSVGLFESGLKQHRVLFCTTSKGKSAIVRHIEPNLCIDDDRAMLLALKPFIDQVVHIETGAQTGAATTAPSAASSSSSSSAPPATVPSFPSLAHFFLPQQQLNKEQGPTLQ